MTIRKFECEKLIQQGMTYLLIHQFHESFRLLKFNAVGLSHYWWVIQKRVGKEKQG